ncbi:MAG: hypothetical protein Q9191_006143 [Dirinaria sp. TL-2023a]
MTIHPAGSSSSTSHTLSFPAQTFAKLSPYPFLYAHLTSPGGPRRPSGRKISECRTPRIHPGSINHASGSAVVRVGDSAAVCGIRGEVLLTKDVADWKHPESSSLNSSTQPQEKTWETRRLEADEISSLSLLVPNVELSTGCSPSHLLGSPPTDLAQTLSCRVLTLLHTSQLISVDDLRIWHYPASLSAAAAPDPNDPDSVTVKAANQAEEDEEAEKPGIKAYWCLQITILFISLDGNPFDAAWGALMAALKDTKLPRTWWDADRELVLCSPEPAEARKLNLSNFPIALTFGIFTAKPDGLLNAARRKDVEQNWILADMDAFEEGCVREEVTVVVDEQQIVRIEKGGGGVVGMVEMRELVARAVERWREWKEVLHRIGG